MINAMKTIYTWLEKILIPLIAAAIFIKKFGISIGFISWWLFASPVILFLILLMNDLKQKDKPQKHRS